MFVCFVLFRKLSRTTARMSRRKSVKQGGTYVYGLDSYVEITSCLLSSAVSLFDHLHDCYVEYTQNYTDKSFDKVYICCSSNLCARLSSYKYVFDSLHMAHPHTTTPTLSHHNPHPSHTTTLTPHTPQPSPLTHHNLHPSHTLDAPPDTFHSLQRFRSAVNLLQRLPPEHARPSLIVSLRSDEEGYSFMLCPNDGEHTHTHTHTPYS